MRFRSGVREVVVVVVDGRSGMDVGVMCGGLYAPRVVLLSLKEDLEASEGSGLWIRAEGLGRYDRSSIFGAASSEAAEPSEPPDSDSESEESSEPPVTSFVPFVVVPRCAPETFSLCDFERSASSAALSTFSIWYFNRPSRGRTPLSIYVRSSTNFCIASSPPNCISPDDSPPSTPFLSLTMIRKTRFCR